MTLGKDFCFVNSQHFDIVCSEHFFYCFWSYILGLVIGIGQL